MRALGLVADAQVESARLVVAILASRVLHVDELVVLGDPAVLVLDARADVAHAVGGRERQLAIVEEILALIGRDEFISHVDAAAGLRVFSGRLAKGEVVPGIVGDVVGTAGLVNLEEVEAAAAVGDLDTDVVAVDTHGPVGNTVGIDLAAEDTDGGGVLVVGGDAGRLATLGGNGASRDGRGRGEDNSSDGGKHFGLCVGGLLVKKVWLFVQRRIVLFKCIMYKPPGFFRECMDSKNECLETVQMNAVVVDDDLFVFHFQNPGESRLSLYPSRWTVTKWEHESA